MSEITVEQHKWVTKLARLRAQRKALENEEKEAVAEIRRFAGARLSLEYGGQKVVSIVTVTSNRIDPTLLRQEYPEVAAACTIPSVSVQVKIADGVL